MDVAQLEALFLLIAKESKMRELDLLDTDLTSLQPNLLGEAFNKLEKVNLSGSKLEGDQLNTMLEIFDYKTLLDINFDYLDLSKVRDEGLAKLLNSIEKLSLKKCSLSSHQVNTALAASRDTKLKKINFHGNNLSSVCGDSLAELALRLDSLEVSQTGLTEAALSSLLTRITSSPSRLRSLTLAGISLASLSPESVSLLLLNNKLERLDLSNCDLSPAQLNSLLSLVRPPLREISLFNVKMEELDKDILRRANSQVFINHRYHI